ncbi:MAG: hypothetical protein FWD61_05385 [Phycisphaerales bacterium]|nr:hypothetical protein [Phycisphaerales bacterium]
MSPSRSAGEDTIVLNADGQPTEVTLKCGGIFKADIYSQNEVEGIADRALSQLVLIDNFEADAIAEIVVGIRAVEAKLQASAGIIRPLQEQLAALDLLRSTRGHKVTDHDRFAQIHSVRCRRHAGI